MAKQSNEVKRAGGSPDGVITEVKAAVTRFEVDANERQVGHQSVLPCAISCAYSEGIISFLVRDADIMLSVRLDEVIAILQSAANTAREAELIARRET